MQSEIVAQVTEAKRKPRPSMWHVVNTGGEVQSNYGRTDKTEAEDAYKSFIDKGCVLFRIPGELESAQAARIEQARDKVIRLAGDCAGTYAPLRDALQALAAVEGEGKHGN